MLILYLVGLIKMMTPIESKISWCELNFENSPNIIPEDTLLKNLLKSLEDSTKENDQKIHIKQIVDIYKDSLEEKAENLEAKHLLLEFFTRFSSNRLVKKYLQVVVGKLNLINCIIKSTTEEILIDIKNKKCCNLKRCDDLLNFVYLMQNSPTFEYEETMEYLFPICYMIFEGFVHHAKSNFEAVSSVSEDLFLLMNAVLKQMLTVFVKNVSYIDVVSKQYSTRLIVLAHMILMHEKVGFDLKTKSGLVFVHSFNIIPEVHRKNFKYKDCPALELVRDYNDEKYFTLINNKMSILNHSDNIVIIYSSILSVVPYEQLQSVKINDKTLICLLYDGLMECAKRKTSIPHIISRTLSTFGKQLKTIPQDLIKGFFVEGISYVWSHIEHFVDTVRNYARLFFVDLVTVAAQHKRNGYNELAEILLENVKKLSPTQSLKFLAMENIALHMGCSYLLENFEDLQDNLLNVISEPSISDQVCKTYIAIMEQHFKEIHEDQWTTIWVTPVTRVLKNCNQCTILCQGIITKAFQLHPGILKIIFPNDYIGNSQECGVLLKCLQYARSKGIELKLNNHETSSALYWRGLIDKDKLEKFMVHQEEEIRISVLASIIDSQKSTEIFLEWELDFLLNYLHFNITSQIPNFRKQVISYYKKALMRINVGFCTIVKNIAVYSKKSEAADDKQDTKVLKLFQGIKTMYKSFLRRLTKQLISYLTFDANYSRRATSLELLITINAVMPSPEWLGCWEDDDVKNCHNILFDSYESNKKMAVVLLKHLPTTAIGFTNVEFTFKYMQRCLNMALDIKPSKTLSAAYLLQVCTFSPHFNEIVQYGNKDSEQRQAHNPNLDMLVVLTGKLIAQGPAKLDSTNAKKTVHYGIILSIRHTLANRDIKKYNEAYSGLFDHLVTTCLNLKDSIMPIVCNPSPEGYLPDMNDEICEIDESAKAQTVLVSAWRTIKEMTLLFTEIIRQTVLLENTIEMLSNSLLLGIGLFFTDIFIKSKHRGVFEQAYVGFSVICELFWTSSNPKVNCLPKFWLKNALGICTGESQCGKLCGTTRRSAGLPFLILSILSSETSYEKSIFHDTMKKLLKVCENVDPSNNEYRTHCMNVLRALFRHSKLGEAVSAHIAEGVIVAITGFKSKTWGVRNSATLLYAALMTRMFGVQRTQDSEDLCMKNRLTVRVFFLRYPELFQFLLQTLKEECTKNNSLIVHPVLMILSRLYPSHLEEYNEQMAKYLPHLTTCLSNPVYRTRELAARASIALIHTEKACSYLEICFSRIKMADIEENECHGLLLQIWYILKSIVNLTEVPLTSFLQNSLHLLEYVGKKFSHMTVSIYMEVVTLFLMKFRKYDDLVMLKTILTLLSRQIAANLLPITSMSKFPQMRMVLTFYIILNKFEASEATYATITNQIMAQLYGHDIEMKRFCLNLLIYLNRLQNDPTYKHALFQTEEMEIPQHIMTLADSFEKSSITEILTHIHPYLNGFLTEEIKFQHYIKQEDQVLLFLLVNYYPCVIKYLNLSKQETLNTLINFCKCDNEQLVSAVVSCISTFLLELDYTVLKYDELIPILVQSASPAASEYRRLAVCDFLSKNYILYCNEDPILLGDELQMVLNIIMVLLEDDDMTVRNAMSNFATILKIKITLNKNSKQISGQRWPVTPEKAKEDLLTLSSIILQKDKAICFIFSWACRHFPDSDSNDASEIFERGELNLYAENVSYMKKCAELLYELLWTLDDGLSYADSSIFIEEHALLVTTILLDSLEKNPSPMMLYKTKVSVICALKSTVMFLEGLEINNNFKEKFRVYLNETILGYLTKHVEHSDLFSVKRFIKNIYEPILKT